ncbi:hypothetical protein [Nodosilinea nodulosa]|uniref:hypothetical protein n=1 Tax=Nodosilinea nodulosa TaxID=416001 RepID=UPI0002E6EB68|nr:hypothetical protein [Nodosilinea nodulosa]
MMNRAGKGKIQGQRSPWQNLLAPMLLASLGLHGLLLLMPIGASDESPIPPPDLEQDSVAITHVPPAGMPDSAAASTPSAVSSASPLRVAQSQAARVARAQAPRSASGARQLAPQRRSQPSTPARPASQPTAAPPPPSTPAASSPAATAPSPPPAPPSRPLFSAEVGEHLLAYVATLNLPASQIEQAAESIQNRFAFNAAAVTRDALNANQQQWEAAMRQDTGLANLSPEIDRTDFSTVYPQRVCLSNLPGKITIGAVANPDGSWRGKPTLLRSSGYGALDRKALEEIQRHTFASAEGVKAYLLTVDTTVDYGPHPCLNPNPDA